ncbi:MAG: L,D-transpeptidase family protein [Desulfovibrio sp.]|jgi:murein L,D-transpeptidase YafK|nr:L,D-transpeptidase family protein [Desulfovibrio sp.]
MPFSAGRSSGNTKASLFVPCLLLTALCLSLPINREARADNWAAPVHDAALPSHFAAVDKERQFFLFFEKKSPIKLKYSYPCATGQMTGDKQKLNDLRTPEGIYFVEYKIASGLDFKEYGGIAYTLNYPNPVDRLRGKTGHGIWIHSKGFGIVPRDTRGCIAIGLDEINEVGPRLTPGTAVILAEKLDEKNVPDKNGDAAKQLRRLMAQWSGAWAARSRKMFDFYDPEGYSRAMPESFAAFRQNKERLFSILKFIKIFNREIHVLEGPGYWVTWAEQLYTASNLSTEGTRRLYWQKDRNNDFRIVGMEWIPRDMGMRAAFQQGRLVAESDVPVSDASSELPRAPRLTMPETPEQADAQKISDLMEDARLAENSTPQKQEAHRDNAGALVAAAPLAPAPSPSQPPAVILWGKRETAPAQPTDAPQNMPERVENATPERKESKEPEQKRMASPPPLQSVPAATPVQPDVPDQEPRAAARQPDPQTPPDSDIEYLSSISADIGDMLEQWRQAWESGRVDEYIRYYDDRAVQQGRMGSQNIRRQKETLWARIQPALVQFSGMRIALDKKKGRERRAPANSAAGNCVVVDMNQIYADSAGHSDKGTKTLQVCSRGQSWKIYRETWVALPPDSNRPDETTSPAQ